MLKISSHLFFTFSSCLGHGQIFVNSCKNKSKWTQPRLKFQPFEALKCSRFTHYPCNQAGRGHFSAPCDFRHLSTPKRIKALLGRLAKSWWSKSAKFQFLCWSQNRLPTLNQPAAKNKWVDITCVLWFVSNSSGPLEVFSCPGFHGFHAAFNLKQVSDTMWHLRHSQCQRVESISAPPQLPPAAHLVLSIHMMVQVHLLLAWATKQ